MRDDSFATLRAFIAVVVLNSVVGLLAYPLLAEGPPFIYILAWLNNLLFGLAALFVAIKIATLLPHYQKVIVIVTWVQFYLQTLIALYEFALEYSGFTSELLFAEIIALLIGTGVWYVVAKGIVDNVNKHAAGIYRHSIIETLIAWGLLIIAMLIVAMGFIGIHS